MLAENVDRQAGLLLNWTGMVSPEARLPTATITPYAPVAQLDRARAYEARGWGLESLQARHRARRY